LEDIRVTQLKKWLSDELLNDSLALTSMNGDAGFRRYFRFINKNQTFIAVDSPVKQCNNLAFTQVQAALAQQGIKVPDIIAYEQEQGFFCLSDFGECLLADKLSLESMDSYYKSAINLLPNIAKMPTENLPVYDRTFVQLELTIFVEWLLGQHLAITLTAPEVQQLEQCFTLLIDNAIEQPQVSMHRDFHSRNLMLLANDELGVIDFQDAVVGPITYDIVSLLRDCYVKWPQEKVTALFDYYCQLMVEKGLLKTTSKNQWQRWFDLMGLQRHIKASGIFARLHHRDNKNGYLSDIPLTLSYIVDVSGQYPELAFLHQLVEQRVLPALRGKTENKKEQ
jgi:aminoglycoside/choline kinase family phosphotransferase